MPQVYLSIHFLPLSCPLETQEIPSSSEAAVPCRQEEMPVKKHSPSQIVSEWLWSRAISVLYLSSQNKGLQMMARGLLKLILKTPTNRTSTLYPRKETTIASMLVNKRLYGFYLGWYTDKICGLTCQWSCITSTSPEVNWKNKMKQKASTKSHEKWKNIT